MRNCIPIQFPCRSSPKNPEAYIFAHIPSPFATGHLGRYSKSSRYHHPRDDWRMDIHLGFWELPGNYHAFPGKPHGTCPIHLGSWSNYAKNRNYLGCETAKLAKLKGSPLTTMGILWMRLQFQAPSPFSKFITQPVAFFGAKRPAAGWFQRILMKFNQIMEHVGRDISS